MTKTFTHTQKIEFAHTDMAGIVHFTQFPHWMAATEEAFLESLSIPSIEQKDNTWFGWPRTRIHCDYKSPLRFPGTIEIKLTIDAMTSRSIHYKFNFFNANNEHTLIAKSEMVTVYIEKQNHNRDFTSIAIPETYIKKLQPYVEHK